MTFLNLPTNASVFCDANVFVYHFAPDPRLGPPCRDLLDRISRGHLNGFTSTHVLSNVAHRLMTFEAIDVFGWPIQGIANRLSRHPVDVQSLTKFRQSVEAIPQLGIHVLSVESGLVLKATEISQNDGLLSGDALVVAVMRQHGLSQIASADADFDRVPGITRFAPA